MVWYIVLGFASARRATSCIPPNAFAKGSEREHQVYLIAGFQYVVEIFRRERWGVPEHGGGRFLMRAVCFCHFLPSSHAAA